MSNGPYSTLPIVWAWEYGARENLTEIRERWFPLVKGEADFFSCFLQELPANATGPHDGYLHDLGDCTNESPGKCQMRDTVLTLSMMRRSFDIVSDMAEALGEQVDPKWAAVLAKVTADPLGWFHGEQNGARMGNLSHPCSFCMANESHGEPTVGDCQGTSNSNGNLRGICAPSVSDRVCPAACLPLGLLSARGVKLCAQSVCAPLVLRHSGFTPLFFLIHYRLRLSSGKQPVSQGDGPVRTAGLRLRHQLQRPAERHQRRQFSVDLSSLPSRRRRHQLLAGWRRGGHRHRCKVVVPRELLLKDLQRCGASGWTWAAGGGRGLRLLEEHNGEHAATQWRPLQPVFWLRDHWLDRVRQLHDAAV